jgi:hypothetical protein
VDMSQCIQGSPDAAEVQAEEGAGSQRLSVSQHLENCRTLNTEVIGFGCDPWRWYRGVGEIHMNKGRVGEERGGKETDGCLLTAPCSLHTTNRHALWVCCNVPHNPGLRNATYRSMSPLTQFYTVYVPSGVRATLLT